MLRLAFGSFIVAILVGAYNKVIQDEAESERERERDLSLPPGYEDRSAYGMHALLGSSRRFVSSIPGWNHRAHEESHCPRSLPQRMLLLLLLLLLLTVRGPITWTGAVHAHREELWNEA